MKNFLILLLSLFTMTSFAQKNEDVLIEPEPHKINQYFKKENSSGIKMVYTISKNKNVNFTDDTLNIDLYNKLGLKDKTIRYEKNKPVSYLEITYDENRNEKKSISTQQNVKERSGITENTYNNQNQLIKMDFQSMYSGNPEGSVTKKYKYIDKKLIEKTIYQNNTLSQIDSFFYTKDKLVLHKLIYPSAYRYENAYTYDKFGQLINKETKTVSKDNQTSTLMGTTEYQYKKDKLVYITDSEGKNLQNNEPVATFYNYHEDNKISAMRVEYKSFYREVNYKYDGQKIVSIKVISNTDNSAYMKFWISASGYYIDKMPFNYEEQFDYDDKDNLISKKIFINDDLITEINYIIEYY